MDRMRAPEKPASADLTLPWCPRCPGAQAQDRPDAAPQAREHFDNHRSIEISSPGQPAYYIDENPPLEGVRRVSARVPPKPSRLHFGYIFRVDFATPDNPVTFRLHSGYIFENRPPGPYPIAGAKNQSFKPTPGYISVTFWLHFQQRATPSVT